MQEVQQTQNIFMYINAMRFEKGSFLNIFQSHKGWERNSYKPHAYVALDKIDSDKSLDVIEKWYQVIIILIQYMLFSELVLYIYIYIYIYISS